MIYNHLMVHAKLKEALIREFNEVNHLNPRITVDDVMFHNVLFEIHFDTNSILSITCLDTSSQFEGTKQLRYNRYSITRYLKGLVLPGFAEDWGTLHKLLDYLREQWGLPLYNEEFLDIPLSGDNVTLRPLNNSLYFIPLTNVTLEFSNKPFHLKD